MRGHFGYLRSLALSNSSTSNGVTERLHMRAMVISARKVYERQKGICPECGNWFAIADMDADHIITWSKGGKTNEGFR